LREVSGTASKLWKSDHECNCEFCDEKQDEFVPDGDQDEYKELRDEAIEIANTLRRCLRWAEFKKIELKKPAKDYSPNWMVPEEL